jgi:hypothetical protein
MLTDAGSEAQKDVTIVGLGEVLFDIFEHGTEALGGAPLNVAVHAHQLATPLDLGEGVVASRIGSDVHGTQLVNLLRSRGLREVFPKKVRPKGQSLGSFSHCFINALISGVFPLRPARSSGFPFVFFALMMILQFVVVLTIYPEAKGISLQETQRKLAIS